MNISTKALSIHSGERLYHQQDVRADRQKPVPNQDQRTTLEGGNRSAAKQISTRTVLTAKELEVLQALFSGKDDNAASFYHHSKIKHVQTGYLLDIKG